MQYIKRERDGLRKDSVGESARKKRNRYDNSREGEHSESDTAAARENSLKVTTMVSPRDSFERMDTR